MAFLGQFLQLFKPAPHFVIQRLAALVCCTYMYVCIVQCVILHVYWEVQ